MLTTTKLIDYIENIFEDNKENEETKKRISIESDSSDDNVYTKIKQFEPNEEDNIEYYPDGEIKNIFKDFDNIKRRGVLKEYIDNKFKITISLDLSYSILSVLNNKFLEMDKDIQLKYILNFHEFMISLLKKNNYFKKFGYNKICKRKDLENDIRNGINSTYYLRYLSDYFHCNIFIIDFEQERIFIVYPERNFNRFKCNILLSFNDNHYEPLFYDNNGIWEYNNPVIEYILSNYTHLIVSIPFSDNNENNDEEIFKLGVEDLNKYIDIDKNSKIQDRIDEIIKEENGYQEITLNEEQEFTIENNNSDIEDNIEDNNEDNNEEEIKVNNTMKIKELRENAIKLDIDITKGKYKNGNPIYKTKNELIDEMINILK